MPTSSSGGAGPPAASTVSAIDLARLAKLVGCSIHDLAEGARADASAMHAEGVMASSKSQLMFEMQPVSTDEEPTGVTTALISVASRPGVLDQGALPKVLTPLGGEPLITHVLRQLALGGITRIVIVLGARGAVIRSAIEEYLAVSPIVRHIEFVELGEQYAAGFACSLIEARRVLGRQPFLLCTADHIFDPKLVASLREVPLAGWDTDAQFSAVALIETQVETLKDMLPLTAVRVRLRDGVPAPAVPAAGGDSWGGGASSTDPWSEPADIGPELLPVRHIGRSIGTPVHGIEAGLYACGPDLLDALEAQKSSRAYFTLAQAMGELAGRGALAAQTTGSRVWYAVETPDQLQLAMDSVVEGEGDEQHPAHTYFPWQVRIARADSFSSHPLIAMRAAAKAAAKDRHRAGRLAAEAAGPAPTAVKVRKERLVIALSAAAASEQAVLRVAHDGARGNRRVHAFSILPAVSDMIRSPRTTPRTSEVPVSPVVTPILSPVKSAADGPTALSNLKGSKLQQLEAPLLTPSSYRSPAPSEPHSSAHAPSEHNVTDAKETVVASLAASLRPMDGADGCAALSIELPQDGTPLGDGEKRTGEQMVDSLAYLVSSESGAPMLAVPECPYDPSAPADATGDEAHSFWTLPSAVTALRLVTIEEPVTEADVESAYAAAAAPVYAIAVEQAVPIIGWVLLATALVCSSISGSLADVQTSTTFHSPPPGDMLRGAWRGFCSTLTLIGIQLYQTRGRSMLGLLRLTRGEVTELVGAGLALSINLGAFQSSLMRTSIAHAATFESMSSLWLVLGEVATWLVFKGPAVSRTTIGAVMIGCFGALLCFREPPSDSGTGHAVTAFGDALALSSGVGACFFLVAAEKLRHALEPLTFLSSVLAIYSVATAVAAFYIDPRPPTLTTNPTAGLFGWLTLSPDRLPLQLSVTAMVDVAGYLAFIAVMKYVPAIMVSAVMLLGPFVSTLEGMVIGVEAVPGLWTMAGAGVITVGSAIIAVESQRKTKTYALGEIG